ncbi:beta-Ala-His dipeptidase [Polypterus senegalus]|uniref:beta-Ala-His dipeptidase n=1 Tax=Polypterus senegalus TaxID=55291 RepID=UPI001966B073|nr:beta-Ala-His dipeptidase [Polypterus senegalus]
MGKVAFFLVFVFLCLEIHSFSIEEISRHINSHAEEYVETLREWVAVESDSSDLSKRDKVEEMMKITAKKLRDMGGDVELLDTGVQTLPSGQTIPMPSLVTAKFGSDASKPTVCVYGHVDVQPALKEDGWSTDPYNLTEIDGKLYGRGASDNKAPVLAWLHAVEAYLAVHKELPVNVKYFIEGMEEVGSPGLDEMVEKLKDSFFGDVDYIIVSDCGWLSTKPAVTYGTRGNCYFLAEVKGPKLDLHSGVYGGTVIEPMTDLIGLLDTLIDARGRILIPGINEAVAPLTEEERKMYEETEFDLQKYKNNTGVERLMYDTKVDILSHRWRYPTLSIHGIEGAFSASGTKTVIPAKVVAKFSIRQVPNMDPKIVETQVTDYLNSMFALRKSPNTLKISMVIGAKPWLADVKDPIYVAAERAIQRVFGLKPDRIREGGSIPVARTLQDVTGKKIIMLPIGGYDDGLHSQNEKMNRYNYIEGTKLFAAYLQEVSQLKR